MTDGDGGFLFAYFTSAAEPDGEQVRLAVSGGPRPSDWIPLDGGAPWLRSDVGERGVRDPYLLRAAGLPGESARFYLLATDLRIAGRDPGDAWESCQRHGSRSIVVWESDDLVSWSKARLLSVAPPAAGNAWAPEATFDPERGGYLVYWASTLHASAGHDESPMPYNRMLIAFTRDFVDVEVPAVWVDPGWSTIDATVVSSEGTFYRFIKDERSPDSRSPGAKYITLERSDDLLSPDWETVAEGIGSPELVHGEGPIATSGPDGEWFLFVDEFGRRRYRAFSAPTVEGPWRHRPDLDVPAGASHGSILALAPEEARRLRAVAAG